MGKQASNRLSQLFPTCGKRTPDGTWRTGWGVFESNIGNGGKHTKKKGVKIKAQKQSYEVSVYKDRLV
jgi:hypothetical protein